MKEPKAPCYGCTDRKVGCHSKCEKYIQFHKDRYEWNKHIFETQLHEIQMNDLEKRRFAEYNKQKRKVK